jgi:asparagine synthase (glutamine-hydrolysing)
MLYTPEFKSALGTNSPREHYLLALPDGVPAQTVDRVMQARMTTILPDDYLMKVDNGTMAVGLEARSPFLDIDLVELAMSVPVSIRFRGGESKHLLRQLALKYVPEECVNRRKQGFVAPVGAWLRQWPDLVDDLILGPHVEQRGWFRRPALQSIVSEHRRGADHAYLLWGLLILELWVRMSLERTISACDKLQAPQKVLTTVGK